MNQFISRYYVKVYSSARAAMTKYDKLNGLNNKFPASQDHRVLEAASPRVKVLSASVSGESSLPGLWTATFWLCPHELTSVCMYS